MNPITVLIPTSPIPSHPSTGIIDATVASVRERLPDAEVVLMIDGVRPEQEHRCRDYEEYVNRLLWQADHEWGNCLPLLFEAHTHQANMTRRALEDVRTPLVLFVEHDTPLVGPEVPWDRMTAAILGGAAHVIRLHHEAQVLGPHEHLMLDSHAQEVAGIPLIRTVQWSQRPHLASADFYREMIRTYFGHDARTFIEDSMHGVLEVAWKEYREAGWEWFKLWMYAPPGDMKRSMHTCGRGEDAKPEPFWAYDGPTPVGAPRPTAERDEERVMRR